MTINNETDTFINNPSYTGCCKIKSNITFYNQQVIFYDDTSDKIVELFQIDDDTSTKFLKLLRILIKKTH